VIVRDAGPRQRYVVENVYLCARSPYVCVCMKPFPTPQPTPSPTVRKLCDRARACVVCTPVIALTMCVVCAARTDARTDACADACANACVRAGVRVRSCVCCLFCVLAISC
jgi:hypothetical protein